MNGLNPKESKQNQNMKTKTKMIFSAALAAALMALPRAQAVTGGATMTNTPADTTATATNSKPADVMAALFGDPVIAKGKGFEIKQSQLDEVMDAIKAKAAAQGQTVPTEELTKTGLEQPDCEPNPVAKGDRCRQGRRQEGGGPIRRPKQSNSSARRRRWRCN